MLLFIIMLLLLNLLLHHISNIIQSFRININAKSTVLAALFFCYIQPGPSKHCHFNSLQLSLWATIIINNAATLICPPHEPEIVTIIYSKIKVLESDEVSISINNSM